MQINIIELSMQVHSWPWTGIFDKIISPLGPLDSFF